jgi:ketol-acid reductoisomerase
MRQILSEIQSGEFAKEWMAEVAAGTPNLLAARRAVAEHEIEAVGQGLREMMPFLVPKTPEDDQ